MASGLISTCRPKLFLLLVVASALSWSAAEAAQSREQRGVPTGDVQSWFLQWPLPAVLLFTCLWPLSAWAHIESGQAKPAYL